MANVFAVMIAIMWPLVLLYAFEYMKGDEARNRIFAFFIMTYGVTLGVCYSADMITMYVFFEMLTLVTIPLVSHYQDHESMYAGRIYAAYTIGGAAVALIAVVMTTMQGSSLFSFGGVDYRNVSAGLMQWIYLLGFFGFGVKAAVFPLYRWLPLASVAPTPVTALLHAVAVVNSGAFACIRLVYYTFGTELLQGSWAQKAVLALALLTILFASCMSLKQRHFKRRLAYSTISNLSYILFAVALMTTQALLAAWLHLLFHSVIKILAFFAAGAILHYAKREYIHHLEGLGPMMPVTFACFTVSACALTGVPPFNGYVS
jgi:multicomponent Na+:H+ antiporter subunit D